MHLNEPVPTIHKSIEWCHVAIEADFLPRPKKKKTSTLLHFQSKNCKFKIKINNHPNTGLTGTKQNPSESVRNFKRLSQDKKFSCVRMLAYPKMFSLITMINLSIEIKGKKNSWSREKSLGDWFWFFGWKWDMKNWDCLRLMDDFLYGAERIGTMIRIRTQFFAFFKWTSERTPYIN